MLSSLCIRNILLFRDQNIEFGEGLNVLTGETGAGKSLLLDCLGFVLGGRRPPVVSPAESGASEVTAVFRLDADHAADTVLDECGIPRMEELVLRRSATRTGRAAVFVNDRRCTAGVLRRLARVLIEVHGQDSERSRMSPSEHRALLDAFADAEECAAAADEAWRELQEGEAALRRAESGRAQTDRDIEFLRHAAHEIAELGAGAGEEEALSARRGELRSIARHQDDLRRAADLMGPSGAEGMASDALRFLQHAGSDSHDGIQEAAEAVDRAIVELNEAGRALDAVRAAFEADPHELERVEERLHALRRLARKHGVAADGLSDLAAEFCSQLTQLESEAAESEELPARVQALESAYSALADRLSGIRRRAAGQLDALVAAELPALKLNGAQFRTAVSPQAAGPGGRDRVIFEAATNASTPAGPIHQIASGGEFSRFMLALKVCLTDRNSGITMIFDEVDRDVGGATADAVGRRLRSLADDTQVLVVTHSPQVAAYGNRHLRVEKHVGNDAARAAVVPLLGNERELEIARMLAGKEVTGEARAAAAALLRGG